MKYHSRQSKPGINLSFLGKGEILCVNTSTHRLGWADFSPGYSYLMEGRWRTSDTDATWVLCGPVQLTEWGDE